MTSWQYWPMPTTSIRMTHATKEILRALAQQEHTSVQAAVLKAALEYRRRRILELGNEAYSVLRADPTAWAAERKERRAWEATLGDGLNGE